MCREAAPSTAMMWSLSRAAAPTPRELRPLPILPRPIKQPCPRPVGKGVCSRARAGTSPFSDQRTKLSFASEPNFVSFYWLERKWAGGPLLGTNSGGSVTLRLAIITIIIIIIIIKLSNRKGNYHLLSIYHVSDALNTFTSLEVTSCL